MYDPQVGRFLSEDPIGFEGGDPNLYRYVGNSSPNFTDPMGKNQMRNCTQNATLWRQAGLPQLSRPAYQIFRQNYKDLEDVKLIRKITGNKQEAREKDALRRDDLYFHCKANCEAAQLGDSETAEWLSISREVVQCAILGDSREICDLDEAINNIGRMRGEKNPRLPCRFLCAQFRPSDLPLQY